MRVPGLMAGAEGGGAGSGNVPVSGDVIPRKVLFGNPDRASVQISPDGRHISWLAALDGVLNVWVAPADRLDEARPVTFDKKRGIRIYQWAYTNRHVLYLQDEGGNEHWNVFAVDLDTLAASNLTPDPEVTAYIRAASERHPEEVIIAVNDRSRQFHDLHRINVLTGADTLLLQNPERIEGQPVVNIMPDDDYNVRFAMTLDGEGATDVFRWVGDGSWEPFQRIPAEDMLTTGPRAFDRTGQVLYWGDSRGRNTAALVAMDLRTAGQTVLAEDDRADAGHLMLHPTAKTPQAVSFEYDRQQWRVLDPSLEADFACLRALTDGDLIVSSRTLDDQVWIVAYQVDDGPVRYYRYDRGRRQAQFLFTNNKALEGRPLAKMRPVVLKSRDGLDMVCYYTLPAGSDANGDGVPNAPLPAVLVVHGGPWGRDSWGYHPWHQWLANRGYAVLSVNYRGSTGFGKAFINAANREWAGKMHDDLIDAVNWMVGRGIARRDKVAIFGGSYGGYAALVGLTFTPEVFACGVDLVGPSRLVTLLENAPPYWMPMMSLFKVRVGDHTTEEGRRFLDTRSPLMFVDRIRRPLLIGQGANDPRVTQVESDQVVRAMQEKAIPVTYAVYGDEGHGFARPENRMSFYAISEAFLSRHLGGRFEPIGDDFSNSSIRIVTGTEQIPGLKAR
jgi:dipeptidyl aminopeptidase/acylaminoacyl peptidase